MLTPALQSEIETAVKGKITTVAPLSAANNAQIFRVSLDHARTVVIKVADRGLDTEAWMLQYLAEKSSLPVPKIHYSNEHVIVMDFVETFYSLDDAGQKHAAELLANLHAIKSDTYGLERDTLVGSLRQPNPQSKDWGQFFTQHRLIYMATEALREGKIDAKTMARIEKLAARVPAMLKDAGKPSLVHGDIWSGNILVCRGRVAAFLDPAIYYADPEVELAFIKLFGTFSEAFFARYYEISPKRYGFDEERADLYALYPLLVHTRLFGASYLRKVQKILDKFKV